MHALLLYEPRARAGGGARGGGATVHHVAGQRPPARAVRWKRVDLDRHEASDLGGAIERLIADGVDYREEKGLALDVAATTNRGRQQTMTQIGYAAVADRDATFPVGNCHIGSYVLLPSS